ncbi:MAG: hypothetical protein ACRBEQ_12000 [Hyphomonas sp.]
MLKIVRLFGLVVVMGLPGTAIAQGDLAVSAFNEGRYSEARALASDSDADAMAFRAKVLLSEAISGDNGLSDALLTQALQAADASLALEPDHADARLQRSLAISLATRAMTAREVQKSDLVDEAKATVESLLAEDETNVYAHMFLSVWHLEVWRRGGRIGAIAMGANRKTARAHYTAAAALADDDASIHWQYGKALAALNARKYKDEINIVLDKAIAAEAETALEQTMQARAKTLKNAMASKPRREVEDLAAAMN